MIVDLLIIAFVGLFAWRGYRRGLLVSLAGLASFFIAVAGAGLLYRALARPIASLTGISLGIASLVAAIAIFVALSVGLAFAAHAIRRVLRTTHWGIVDSIAGGALGSVWALGFTTLALLLATLGPMPEGVRTAVRRSTLARAIERDAPSILRAVSRVNVRGAFEVFFPSADRRVGFTDAEAVDRGAVQATTDFQRVDPAARDLFDFANRDRIAAGVPALRWDAGLAKAAIAHAADMYIQGYFGHEDLQGRSPGARLMASGVIFQVTGENLALAPSSVVAHARLMASKRHRAHVLGPGFTRVGIGAMFGRQGLLVVEEFAG